MKKSDVEACSPFENGVFAMKKSDVEACSLFENGTSATKSSDSEACSFSGKRSLMIAFHLLFLRRAAQHDCLLSLTNRSDSESSSR